MSIRTPMKHRSSYVFIHNDVMLPNQKERVAAVCLPPVLWREIDTSSLYGESSFYIKCQFILFRLDTFLYDLQALHVCRTLSEYKLIEYDFFVVQFAQPFQKNSDQVFQQLLFLHFAFLSRPAPATYIDISKKQKISFCCKFSQNCVCMRRPAGTRMQSKKNRHAACSFLIFGQYISASVRGAARLTIAYNTGTVMSGRESRRYSPSWRARNRLYTFLEDTRIQK